jgi:hypothetical protein
MGELDFEAELNDNTVVYEDRLPRQYGAIYRAALRFRDNGLTVDENYVIGYFGMNVSFAGEYTRR